MSTTQKRGFRLPWSSDPEPEEGAEDAQRLGELLESVSGSGKAPQTSGRSDLGEGPFRAAPVEPVDDVNQSTAASESEAVVLESVVDQRAGEPENVAAVGSREPGAERDETAWPATDQHPAPAPPESREPAPAVAAATPRRDNPLVAGLVKAMREAAETSRSETITALQAEATAQVQAIRSGATDEAEALRKRADDDIDEIREWAKAEVARIKQESEQRVVDRRDNLEHELENHARDVDAQAAQVENAVAGYEREMESFFERLLAETDPARLAALAEGAPAPPILSELPAVRRASARQRDDETTGQATKGWPPEAADTRIGESIAPEGQAPDAEAPAADEPAAESAAGEAHLHDAETGTVDHVQGDSADEPLDAEAAAVAEAEALEELGTGSSVEDVAMAPADDHVESTDASDHQPVPSERGRQRVIVTGLATVAGISAFKSALGQVRGVQSVSVMAGDPGSFVFTVAHDPELDLRAALAELPGFEAHITADDGDTVHVSAREPAA